jgi:hypothetical protein
MANLVSNSFLSITDLGGRIGRIRWRNTATTQFTRGSRFEFFGETEFDDYWPSPYPDFARMERRSAEITAKWWQEYETRLQTSGQESKAADLAERYHRETEAYDRTVCTGPIIRGSIMPNGGHEMTLSARNASKVLEQILREAEQHGISRQEMQRAISRHHWR